MKKISEQELMKLLKDRQDEKIITLEESILENMDLSQCNLNNINFTFSNFIGVKLENTNFQNSNLSNVYFSGCSLKGAVLENTNLTATDFRFCDLSKSNIRGANLFGAILQGALLDGIQYNNDTRFFSLYCPETGALIGYKKCFNYRIVQLLIPKDAKRSSATTNECRCDRAKVLTIKSMDSKKSFYEARSYVDENYIYRAGKIVVVNDFNEDRWAESTTGIHFYLTREEAMGYL